MAEIKGHVWTEYDKGNQTTSETKVVLKDSEGKIVDSTVSDDKGNYSFKDVGGTQVSI